MGLSVGERREKFHWSIMGLRRKLVDLAEILEGKTGEYSCKMSDNAKLVRSWVDMIDHIVGVHIVNTNFNSAYWILGSNSEGFRSLWEKPYDLGNIGAKEHKDELNIYNPNYGTYAWWDDSSTLVDFAKLLCGDDFNNDHRSEILVISHWWDAFAWVDSVLYGIFRYEDDAFKEIHDSLYRLIGQMVNYRYDIMVAYRAEDLTDKSRNIEHALLCKYRIFRDLVKKERNAAEKRFNKKNGTTGWFKTFTERMEIGPIIEQIGKMSMAATERALKEMENETYKRNRECRNKEYDKKKKDKPDGLFGPSPRERAVLEKIMGTTTNREEFEAARLEMENVYNIFGGGWDVLIKHIPLITKYGRDKALEMKVAENKKKAKKGIR